MSELKYGIIKKIGILSKTTSGWAKALWENPRVRAAAQAADASVQNLANFTKMFTAIIRDFGCLGLDPAGDAVGAGGEEIQDQGARPGEEDPREAECSAGEVPGAGGWSVRMGGGARCRIKSK